MNGWIGRSYAERVPLPCVSNGGVDGLAVASGDSGVWGYAGYTRLLVSTKSGERVEVMLFGLYWASFGD